jgi:Flp pilus assembly protein TadB
MISLTFISICSAILFSIIAVLSITLAREKSKTAEAKQNLADERIKNTNEQIEREALIESHKSALETALTSLGTAQKQLINKEKQNELTNPSDRSQLSGSE